MNKNTLISLLLPHNNNPSFALALATFAGEFQDTPLQALIDDTRSQGKFHTDTVWIHTQKVVGSVRPSLVLRLAALFHDCGKPSTRSADNDGNIHFYGHAETGAELAGEFLRHVGFDDELIGHVQVLIHNHMRVNCFKPTDSDRAVRRLRKSLDGLHDLAIELAQADNENHSGDFRRDDNILDLARRFKEVV